ncbi:MAG: cob(I)yrinic acid a,c-diamide adenosyltransferase [Desulfobacteraceae bacterium]|nr:cob(I)yrinic acid a,c-diamide adenosyltransferase [Desulfobacteraceae bacterium]
MTGYVHIYTGDGKGKTTAALGLAVRAMGAGLRIYVGQFMKKFEYSELSGLQPFGNRITLEQYGTGCHLIDTPSQEDLAAAEKGLEKLRAALESGSYDVVIADEINVALDFKLFTVQDVLKLIEIRPAHVELILTGRNARPEVIEAADLVTEMKSVKHYYKKGVQARKGIES